MELAKQNGEQAAADLQGRLSRVLQGSNDGFWEWSDLTKEEFWWSSRMYEMLGYEDSEFVPTRTRFLSMIHPEDRDITAYRMEHLTEEGPYQAEYRIQKKSGDYVWFHAQGTIFRDARGAPYCVSGSVRDVSQEHEADEKLRASEELFRCVFDSSALGMAITNLAGGFTRVNDAACQMLGYTREEMLELSFADVTASEDLNNSWEHFQQLLRGEIDDYTLEKRYRHKEGHLLWGTVTISLVRDSESNPDYIVAQLQDITERKYAEQELLIERQRFFYVLETLPAMICLIRPDSSIAFANRAFRENLGETLDRTNLNSHFGDAQPGSFSETYEILKTGKPFRWEVVTPDHRVYEVHDFPFTDVDGSPMILEMNVDITESRRAQKDLAENKQRYQSLFDESPVPLWEEDFSAVKAYLNSLVESGVTDFTGYFKNHPECIMTGAKLVNITDINHAALQLHEAASKSQLLENLVGIVTEKSFNSLQAQLIAIAEGHTSFDCEASAKTLSGRELDLHLQWRVIPGYEDSLQRVHVSTIDITERKQAASRVRESEERFRSLFEQSPIAIQLYDETGTLVDLNQRALDLLGIEDKQPLLGHQMWKFKNFTPERVEQLQRGEPIFFSMEMDFERIKRLKLFETTNSGCLNLDVYVYPLTVAGKITGYTIQQIDMTDRKRMEAQLLQSQKMESIGRLAGGIAHDFNNILMPIVGYVELAMLTMQKDDPAYAGLMRVQDAADRATGLVRQILAYGRKQILQKQVLSLNSVIADFSDMLRSLIGEDIQLQVKIEEQLQLVDVDQLQIEQVLMNLAVNARDAMPEGGRLMIETSNVTLSKARIDLLDSPLPPGQYVMMAVLDTGHGMDAQVQKQIFEPFYTTKEPGKGTGLGLSTTMGIIQQHGGSILVHSKASQGTSFQVYLPVVDAPARIAQPNQSETIPKTGSGMILLVEDEAMVRRMVSQSLTALGYRVIEAHHPDQALAAASLHQDSIALLLTDVAMQEMSGIQLYQKIAEFIPELQVLYMTGHTDQVVERYNSDLSDANLLQKPFNLRHLGQKVTEAISKKSDRAGGQPEVDPESLRAKRGETVLVVDDDAIVLDSESAMLRLQGYQVLSAVGPQVALELSHNYRGAIDLLLTDVSMPGMNGYELAQQLLHQRPELKVLFISGYSHDVVRAGAAEDEEFEFLNKPVLRDHLARRIRKVLDGQGASGTRNAPSRD